MKTLLQVDFDYQGPFGEVMSNALKELAETINNEPGMIWKLWTENEKVQQAGGVYLFESEATAQAYLTMHTARLQGMGIGTVRGKTFNVNEALSAINLGPFNHRPISQN